MRQVLAIRYEAEDPQPEPDSQFESAWARYCAEGVTARARYPAPTVGLPPWYRFATNGLLLRYIAGGGGRYTNQRVAAFKGFCRF